MNLNIYCFATISKKLIKICQDNPLFIHLQPLSNGKIEARLKISCPDDIAVEDVKKIEDISIMLEIDDVVEDVKDLGSETPIQNLYTSAERIENSKLAITEPDGELKKYENVKKTASSEKAEVLQEKIFPKKINKKNVNFISNYDDLVKIIFAVKDVDKEIPSVPSNKRMNRLEAIEFGKVLQSIPKLPVGAYISNETGSRLCIDDLNLSLKVNEISDLSVIPAKRLKDSRQLRSCCERGFVKFRSRGEYNEWCDKQTDMSDANNDGIGLKILDKKVEEYEPIDMDDVPPEKVSGSKSKTFSDKELIDKRNTILKNIASKKSEEKKSDKTEIDENFAMEITGEEETDGEKELKEIIKDLPEEKENNDVENKIEDKQELLLSDLVEKQEKNKIKRVG